MTRSIWMEVERIIAAGESDFLCIALKEACRTLRVPTLYHQEFLRLAAIAPLVTWWGKPIIYFWGEDRMGVWGPAREGRPLRIEAARRLQSEDAGPRLEWPRREEEPRR